ncbi:flavin-containing monooxygenase [Agrobacterium tumefaciens]|uniref:NAD(P)/FAD-dependent oxidoreductase n=1 Tax=Agrobacterium tumefaciens TaxID=358 RepID=A0AA44F5T9_AGRTU|nr:NAD(P)/FAD-dependent oxidoreductase [Agrobacterium tumefaciens]NSL21304.1 NAD(P)/FAD-dependent oxidoreductase [Agrobacterium tumefaciens]NTB83876.1 NAD(P)/FAD-dependent oxidoreductase [Agrobacterium tumefaciens]NTC20655.1 NAD(P)/FAD-dependent oxidoreductase [Agrobacterium tumefaciens]NTC29347.1 NAD(P)/FAD-dependent oxidoreductase [Agrobacterium tumefaciens]NTC57843.1 NAD(P)/FAD-dependent oxidoreductase [Agrobacterium tumefaciens]
MSIDLKSTVPVRDVVDRWIAQLNNAIAHKDYGFAASLFSKDGYWRDIIALTWHIKTFHGSEEIEAMLKADFGTNGLRDFRIEGQPRYETLGEFGSTIEAFVAFETNRIIGRGYLRLIPDEDEGGYSAITFLTSAEELKGFPEKSLSHRKRDSHRATERDSKNWLDERIHDLSYDDRDPQVLIIGAGQAGLAVAARLRQLAVDTLVIDKIDRVGDNWRHRYHSLTLHNEICTNHLPYIPYPASWPVFIPKDKLANWMEFYADSMEINVWTKTAFLAGDYNDSEKKWDVTLRLPDGRIRKMRPSHVVMAVGVSGTPNIPEFDGKDAFNGRILHSSQHGSDVDVAGKKVLVVGSGTSAHDIAQDAYLRGADVTMLQRSSATVVSIEQSGLAYSAFRKNEGVRPIDETDLMVASVPYDLLRRLHGPLSRKMAEADRELLRGLEDAGFKLDNGEDDTGFFLKLVRYLGGYYIDVGASQLIIDGKIKLKSNVGVDRLVDRGVVFSDGELLETDVIVLGTGYRPLQHAVGKMFGPDIAERVGPIWGLGKDNELRNMWVRTTQPGLYIAGGTFTMCRFYSKVTALLIKAELEQLIE